MSTRFDRSTRARRGRVGAVAVLACVPLLAACGGDTEKTSSVATTTSASAGTSSQSSSGSPMISGTASGSTTACTFDGATTAPVDTTLAPMTVTGVRAGQQDCFDRLVIDLAGDAAKKPGYQVRYVSQVRQDASGKPVVLRGGAFLTVVVGAPSYDAAGQPTYLPADATELVTVTGYKSLRQIASAGSFEGMTTFGVGVREQLPFKASIMDDGGKTRLVVDVAHAAK